jgi:hypothetical protein
MMDDQEIYDQDGNYVGMISGETLHEIAANTNHDELQQMASVINPMINMLFRTPECYVAGYEPEDLDWIKEKLLPNYDSLVYDRCYYIIDGPGWEVSFAYVTKEEAFECLVGEMTNRDVLKVVERCGWQHWVEWEEEPANA